MTTQTILGFHRTSQKFKLSLLLSFYFHVVLQHLKTFTHTNFRFKRVFLFATLGQVASTLFKIREVLTFVLEQ